LKCFTIPLGIYVLTQSGTKEKKKDKPEAFH